MQGPKTGPKCEIADCFLVPDPLIFLSPFSNYTATIKTRDLFDKQVKTFLARDQVLLNHALGTAYCLLLYYGMYAKDYVWAGLLNTVQIQVLTIHRHYSTARDNSPEV